MPTGNDGFMCKVAGCVVAAAMGSSYPTPVTAAASEAGHTDGAGCGCSVAPLPAGSWPVGHHQSILLTVLITGKLRPADMCIAAEWFKKRQSMPADPESSICSCNRLSEAIDSLCALLDPSCVEMYIVAY